MEWGSGRVKWIASVGVVDGDRVGSSQVDTDATGSRPQQKDERVRAGRAEAVNGSLVQ